MHLSSKTLLALVFPCLPKACVGTPLNPRQESTRPQKVCDVEFTSTRWEHIGDGAYGWVYLTDLQGFGEVAVKEARGGGGADLLRGARIAQEELNGEDHHTTIHKTCEQNTLFYTIMEYIPGASIKERIDGGTYNIDNREELQALVERDICDAIEGIRIMHEKGLAHNDAQGKNFVVGPQNGKSAWVDYDQTNRAQPGGDDMQRDVTWQVRTAIDMAGGASGRASKELIDFRSSRPKDIQTVYDKLCSDERIPIIKYTKHLGIYKEFTPEEGISTFDWLFFSLDYRKSAECSKDNVTFSQAPLDNDNEESFPGGDFDVDLDGRSCQYKNNGENYGNLWCEGDDARIPCWSINTDPDPPEDEYAEEREYICGNDKMRMPKVTCPYE